MRTGIATAVALVIAVVLSSIPGLGTSTCQGCGLKKKKERKKEKRNQNSLWYLLNNIKHTNIYIMGVPEEKREKGPNIIFKDITAENFSYLEKETVTKVQEVQGPIQY